MTEIDEEISLEEEDEGSDTGKNTKKPSETASTSEATDTAKQLGTLTEAIYQLTKSMTEQSSVGKKRSSEGSHTTDSSNPASKKAKKVASSRESSVSEPAVQKAGTSASSDESEDCEALMGTILNTTHGLEKSGADKKSPDPEDELLNELLREYESDDATGDKLKSDQLTKLLNKMFRSKIADKTLKDKMEKQLRPENCPNVKATRVNGGIWRRLRDSTKKRDVYMFKLQQALVKGIIPVAIGYSA